MDGGDLAAIVPTPYGRLTIVIGQVAVPWDLAAIAS